MHMYIRVSLHLTRSIHLCISFRSLLDSLTPPPPSVATGAGRFWGAEDSVKFKALQLIGCFVGLQVRT